MATEKVIEWDDPVNPTPETVQTLVIEGIEAACRKQMAAIAAHQVRGFDSGKVRARMLAALDDDLDLYNLAKTTDDW